MTFPWPLNPSQLFTCKTWRKVMDILTYRPWLVYMACFCQILAQILEVCRKSAWNLKNGSKRQNYLAACPFIECVRHNYNDLFKSSSRNYSLFCHEKDEVFVNLQMQTELEMLHIHYQSIDADIHDSPTVCIVLLAPREPVQFIVSFYCPINQPR